VGEIARLVNGASLLELGAGMGCYTAALRDLAAHSAVGASEVRGFDGAPGVTALTDGLIGEADLTTRLQLRQADWLLSLEVGEHVPSYVGNKRPATKASLSARSRRRLPQALASPSQSVAWAALASHIGLIYEI